MRDPRPAALGALVAAVALLVVPGLDDPFLVPKAALAVVGASAITLAWAGRVWRRGRLLAAPAWRGRTVILAVVGVYAVALVAATFAHERPLLAVAGHAGRHTGLAVALAGVVVLLAAVEVGRRAPLAATTPVVVASVLVSVYAFVQAAGADPVAWDLVEGGPPVFSTLGNANFLSGWLGVAAPVAAWAALASAGRRRVAAAGAAVIALAAAVASGSVQGVGAGVVATALVVVAGLWARGGSRVGGRAAGVVAVLAGLGALVGAAAGVWPGVLASARTSLANRLELWEIALRLASEHPWRGVGLGGYRGRFAALQDAEAAAARGLDRIADSPHSVPLELLASGGWPLLVAWLAVVVVAAAAVVRGWRGGDGHTRLAAVGLGGAGLAYLAQAAVSIDVAPLALLGALLAGLAVGNGGAQSAAEAPHGSAAQMGVLAARGVAVAAVALAAAAAVGAGSLVAADAWVAAAARADEEEQVVRLERAARLAPWEPAYPSALGRVLVAVGERDAATAAFEETVRRDPRAIAAWLNLARVATARGDTDRADEAYAAAVRLHPRTPAVLAEVGRHELDHSRAERAVGLLERAVAGDDHEARWWWDLADAREAVGDEAGAAAARAEARQRERSPRWPAGTGRRGQWGDRSVPRGRRMCDPVW